MDFDSIINDAHNKGLISFQREDWLERAIAQHNPNVNIKLAQTRPYRLPRLDMIGFAILYIDRNN